MGLTGQLFPALDAELTLSPDGEHRSRLRLVGSYRPPLSRVGEVLDRTIMLQVAEATIRALLERSAEALTAAQPEFNIGFSASARAAGRARGVAD